LEEDHVTPRTQNVIDWRGRTVVDHDGNKVGKIEEIYLDTQTADPEWALVNTGLFGTKSTFVPIRDASAESDDEVVVPFEKSHIKDAPGIDPDGRLSHEEEATLYRHYGLDSGEGRSGSGTTEREGRSDRQGRNGGDDAMTRSEEELRVGKDSREAGVARLKKYVVTENVQTTVPVQREEVRVEREPITDANRDAALSGPEITESEHEVTLHEEEPVVEKRAVPKERVRMAKDSVTEDREISEEVRKERIESEGDRR